MKELFIIHFRPLENYPPIQNFLKVASSANQLDKIYCFSSKGKLPILPFNDKVKSIRPGKSHGNKMVLWFSFFYFSLYAFFALWRRGAESVIYYETISALPLYLYKRLINKKVKIYIHYHEYVTIEEYQRIGLLEKSLHKLEPSLYETATWISHTNSIRLNKFLKDHSLTYDESIHKTLPNFPHKSWAIQNQNWKKGEPLKFIYVGYTLTFEGNYLKELVEFLRTKSQKIELNLYCFRSNDFMQGFVGSDGNLSVKLYSPLSYNELPKELSKHHIGLILYKAKTQNYIYNAPNKLFEYLSCGLDVWYPKEMKGIHEFDSGDKPRVRRLDFSNLELSLNNELISAENSKLETLFFAEEVYQNLINHIVKDEDTDSRS